MTSKSVSTLKNYEQMSRYDSKCKSLRNVKRKSRLRRKHSKGRVNPLGPDPPATLATRFPASE